MANCLGAAVIFPRLRNNYGKSNVSKDSDTWEFGFCNRGNENGEADVQRKERRVESVS